MAFFRAIDFNPSPRAGRIGRGFPGMGRGFPGGGGIGGLLGRIVNRTRGRMPRPIRKPMPMPSIPPIRPGYIPQIDPVALQELQDRMANVSPPPVVPDRPQQFNPSFFQKSNR